MNDINDGVELCKVLYDKLNGCGFYPALTGGSLYKTGNRKDIDIVLYRNRQQARFETSDIEKLLADCGLTEFKHFGFVSKAKWKGLSVDILNPETMSCDDYNKIANATAKEQVAIDCANSQNKQPSPPPFTAESEIPW